MPSRDLLASSLSALALTLALAGLPERAAAQPTEPGPGTAAPGQPAPGGATAGAPARLPDEKAPDPEWMKQWNAINETLRALPEGKQRDEDAEAAAGTAAAEWLKLFASDDDGASTNAVRELVSLYRGFEVEAHLTAAARDVMELQGKGISAANKLSLLIARAGMLVEIGAQAKGDAKHKAYEQAVDGCNYVLEHSAAQGETPDALIDLPVNDVAALHLMHARALGRLGRMADAIASWHTAVGRQPDRTRKLALLEVARDYLICQNQWAAVIDLVPAILATRDDLSVRIEALTVQAAGQRILERQDDLVATLTELKKLKVPTTTTRLAIERRWLQSGGRQSAEFWLPDFVSETPKVPGDYRGRTLVLVFVDPGENRSLDTLAECQKLFSRYLNDKLAVATVAAGKRQNMKKADHERLLAKFEMLYGSRPRGDYLVDNSLAVARSFGLGPRYAADRPYPGVAIIDATGKLVWASAVSSSLRELKDLRGRLEETIELSAGGGVVLERETGPLEDTPEFVLLQTGLAELNFPSDAPVRDAKSLKRALLLLGDEGRERIKAWVLKANAPVDQRLALFRALSQ